MNGYETTENEPSPELRPFDPREGSDFNTEQRTIDDWANAGSGYVGEVIAMTSIQGVRAGIEMARRVALEHENRAAAARRIEQRLREELNDASLHGLDETVDETVRDRHGAIGEGIGEAARSGMTHVTKKDPRLVAVNEAGVGARDY